MRYPPVKVNRVAISVEKNRFDEIKKKRGSIGVALEDQRFYDSRQQNGNG